MSGSRWGIVLAIVGLAAVAVSLLADRIGVGAAQGVMGWKQILGAAVGIILIVVGAWLARRRAPQG